MGLSASLVRIHPLDGKLIINAFPKTLRPRFHNKVGSHLLVNITYHAT